MNKLQTFCAALECGFLSAAQVLELEKLDPLFPVLVRCGGGRFTCAAQYVSHFSRCVAAGGDYVRDVSLPIGWEVRAASWAESCPVTPASMLPASFVAPRSPAPARQPDRSRVWFNEGDCGGVFDGRGVISDADPGL